MKGGQAQGPLVKSSHIPLLSEGIQANPGLLRQKGGLITKISFKKAFNVFILIFTPLRIRRALVLFFVPADFLLSLHFLGGIKLD